MAATPRSYVDPNQFERILGKGFGSNDHQPVLVIGKHQWNRWTLGRLGCPHPVAAANLNRVVKQLGIESLNDLATRAHEIGVFKGLGRMAYFTILAILHEHGWDVDDVHGADEVTYGTLKQRALKEEQTDSRKRRKR